MKLRLYNSLSRKVEQLRPASPDGVLGLYTCGPTVYNYQHIGNYRTYVFEDVLRRSLGVLGYKVRHVMNITDVGHLTSQADEGEDKMEVGARREGKSAREIAAFYSQAFFADIAELNILKADVICPAAEHVPEQIEQIKRLEDKGLTYRISDGIYFDVSKFPAYGALIGAAHLEGSQEGARVQANPEKRGPADFALWKFSAPGERRQMEWVSPWGKGFPGWHIECSAMSMKYLGEQFDIHCGGVDHIPIHHTNEIAQAEGASGKSPWVRFWLHGEFLVVNKAKMAKSSGGGITLADLKSEGFSPLDFRYFCFGAHYRRQLDFSWEAVAAARNARRRLKERASSLTEDGAPADSSAAQRHIAAFHEKLADDLNMPEALAVVWDALKSGAASASAQQALLAEADKVLALRLLEPSEDEPLPEHLGKIFAAYEAARTRKDFSASDALRKELAAQGIRVEDTAAGSKWKRS